MMFKIIALALLAQSPFYIPPPSSVSLTGASAVGVDATGAGTCSGADAVVFDNNGVAGCQKLSDTAPQGLLLRAQPGFAGGTQTAASTTITGGQDESLIAIDGADPTVTCAGDNDTVTVSVTNSNNTTTSTILTEGTEWTAAASVATTCASLAAAVDALAGVGASCTSPNVRITLDLSTASVFLAESTAACTTVTTGTHGSVVVRSKSTLFVDPDTGNDFIISVNADSDMRVLTGAGGDTANIGSSGMTITTAAVTTNIIRRNNAATQVISGGPADGGTAVAVSLGSPAGVTYSTTAKIASFINNATEVAYIRQDGSIISSNTGSIGWTPVAGADTACNTTCTSACVFGFNLTAGVPGTILACTDATADICLCAGGS